MIEGCIGSGFRGPIGSYVGYTGVEARKRRSPTGTALVHLGPSRKDGVAFWAFGVLQPKGGGQRFNMIRLGDLLLYTGLHLEGKKGATKLGTASVSPRAVAPRKRSQAAPVMISRGALFGQLCCYDSAYI